MTVIEHRKRPRYRVENRWLRYPNQPWEHYKTYRWKWQAIWVARLYDGGLFDYRVIDMKGDQEDA